MIRGHDECPVCAHRIDLHDGDGTVFECRATGCACVWEFESDRFTVRRNPNG